MREPITIRINLPQSVSKFAAVMAAIEEAWPGTVLDPTAEWQIDIPSSTDVPPHPGERALAGLRELHEYIESDVYAHDAADTCAALYELLNDLGLEVR